VRAPGATYRNLGTLDPTWALSVRSFYGRTLRFVVQLIWVA